MTPTCIQRKERRSALIRLKISRIASFLVCARDCSNALKQQTALSNPQLLYKILFLSGFAVSYNLSELLHMLRIWGTMFWKFLSLGGTKLKKRSPPQLVWGVSVNIKILILSRVIFICMSTLLGKWMHTDTQDSLCLRLAPKKKHFNDFMKLKIKTSVLTS